MPACRHAAAPVSAAAAVRQLPRPPLAMLPAALVLGLWLFWSEEWGGYFPAEWYPSAIFLVLLLVVTAIALGRVLPPARVVRVPLLVLAALVAWSYLGILWSVSPGAALDSANQLVLYLACAWVLALLPWTVRRAAVFLAAWGIGLGVVAAVSLVEASGARDFAPYLFELRYQDPVGYANGNAALAFAAVWPMLMLASRRGASILSAGFFLALATLLVEFATLSQSRGSLIGAGVAAVAMILLAPERLALLSRLIALVAALAIAIGPILDVYETGSQGGALAPAIDHAVGWIAVSVAVAGLLGALLGFGARFLSEREGLRRQAQRGALVGVAVLAAVALAAAAVNAGRIADRVDEEVSSISSSESSAPERTRAASLDPYERPDYWRVALDMFSASPLIGAGTGSFEHEYTADRRYAKHSRFAHDVYLRFLGEEGLVGLLLLLGFLVVTAVFAARARWRGDAGPAWVVAAAIATMAYVLTHASLDWLDELPAVFAPALALPLVALATTGGGREDRSPGGWPAALLGGLVAAFALVALTLPWLSLRYLERAEDNLARGPGPTFADLRRAHDLDPISLVPLLAEARIAIDYGEDARARRALAESIEIEDNWYAHFQLALLDSRAGRFADARREIARARELSASDSVLARFEEMIEAGERLDPAAINRELANAASARFTATPR